MTAAYAAGPLRAQATAAQDTARVDAEAAAEDTVGGVTRSGPNACASCHRGLPEERLATPARGFGEDIHGARGLACASCHGGDAATREARIAHAGMLARPPRARIPEMCGRCHSNPEFMRRFNPEIRVDQVVRYATSVHGERLMELGDRKVATCVDCHSSHGIKPSSEQLSTVHPTHIPDLCGSCHADAEYMASYGIPTDQVEEYRSSVHWAAVSEGDDLSAPVCNDCHGNHGAVPPGYASVGRVCAECHVQIGDYFGRSPHDPAFLRLGLPGCATCHENHAIGEAGDEFLGLGGQGTCGGDGCHSGADDGGRVATAMRSLIDSLVAEFERADSILVAAEQAGMHVSDAQFELLQGRNALVSARAATHSARLDSVRGRVEEGLQIAAAGYAEGRAAFEELETRRKGLAVSAAVIVVLIGGLALRIRQLEKAA